MTQNLVTNVFNIRKEELFARMPKNVTNAVRCIGLALSVRRPCVVIADLHDAPSLDSN